MKGKGRAWVGKLLSPHQTSQRLPSRGADGLGCLGMTAGVGPVSVCLAGKLHLRVCLYVCVRVRIGCLGQSGSFLVVCVSVGESPCLCACEHLRGPRTCRLRGGLSGYVPFWV